MTLVLELIGSVLTTKKQRSEIKKISSCPLITVYIERSSLVIVEVKSLVEVTVLQYDGRLSWESVEMDMVIKVEVVPKVIHLRRGNSSKGRKSLSLP